VFLCRSLPLPAQAGAVQPAASRVSGASTDALIARGDAAMDEAKLIGRNQVIPIEA
jgi:hypothetical protein